ASNRSTRSRAAMVASAPAGYCPAFSKTSKSQAMASRGAFRGERPPARAAGGGGKLSGGPMTASPSASTALLPCKKSRRVVLVGWVIGGGTIGAGTWAGDGQNGKWFTFDVCPPASRSWPLWPGGLLAIPQILMLPA